jgi:F-type H+-transporting ATPase subunit epsilon
MFDRPFALEIMTPEKTVLTTQAVSVSAPGVQGGFQVLVDHAPLLSALEQGRIIVRGLDGTVKTYTTSGGFIEVRDNHVKVLLDTAERVEEIDVERAKGARERAERRLHERTADVDVPRAEASLRRALNRLRSAGAS